MCKIGWRVGLTPVEGEVSVKGWVRQGGGAIRMIVMGVCGGWEEEGGGGRCVSGCFICCRGATA